ncbi:MAG: hypothetical protein HY319_26135 [Armatimonadetes bacterium]|nr:hypothetical protein [Armatimonadota bacterium]
MLSGTPGYESRPQQLEMARAAARAIENKEIAVVEAGTGTGKSLAYLVPAILWSRERGEPVVVSTRTLNLQQQLLEHDIPRLEPLMDQPIRVAPARGWSNYLCLRRLGALPASGELPPEHEPLVQQLIQALARGAPGVRQHLQVAPDLWARTCADATACSRQACSWYADCYLFRERRELERADVIITNHSLVMADLALKRHGAPGILPRCSCLVLDEAHHLEAVATEHLGRCFSRQEFLRLSEQLYSPGAVEAESGYIPALRARVSGASMDTGRRRRLLAVIDRSILATLPDLGASTESLFEALQAMFTQDEPRMVLTAAHLESDAGVALRREGAVVAGQLERCAEAFRELSLALEEAPVEGASLELQSMSGRFKTMRSDLEFCLFPESENWVYWTQTNRRDSMLVATPLDVGNILSRELFAEVRSAILTSATLAVGKDLRFFEQRVGLDQVSHRVQRLCLESPFDFQRQAYLGVATDMPDPGRRELDHDCVEPLVELMAGIGGRSFVLVTSWRQLRQMERMLRPRLDRRGVQLLVQGEAPGGKLLERFRSRGAYVLLGTDSFWEGVDVPGEALRCVVLARLPFRVPSDPIVQAHSRRIEGRGGNAFEAFLLPLAILKFRQGFGRLVRTATDRGLVLVLDPRIRSRRYGRQFLDSLPGCVRKEGSLLSLVRDGLRWLKGPADPPCRSD